jgi:Tol biopolymer transport system component
VVNRDGSGNRELAGGISAEHGNWSPDAKQFVFMSFQHDDWDIWAVGLDGVGLRNLTHAPGYQAVPVWSPDGSTIAFGADPDGLDNTRLSQADIYAMQPDGKNVRRLTSSPNGEGFPAWTSDGRLSYQRVTNGGAGPIAELWTMDPDGTHQRRFATDVAFASWRPHR